NSECGMEVRTGSGSDRVLRTPSGGRLKAGLKTPERTRSGRLVYPRSFEQIEHCEHRGTAGTSGTCGTAGQIMLNILSTTISCPTKLSHFGDRWDKNGKSYAFRRDPTRSVHDSLPHRPTGFTPKAVTLTFWGQ